MLPGSETLHTLLRLLTWSLTALSNGVFPDRDFMGNVFTEQSDRHRFEMAGKPLADGFVGCWSELRGDWKFLKEAVAIS